MNKTICQCDGTGVIVTCIDDMCRGRGECMHGDGERDCVCLDAEPDEDDGGAK